LRHFDLVIGEERRHQRRRVGAGEHLVAPILVHRRLHHDRHPPPGLGEGAIGGHDAALDRQHVLLGFNEQRIDPAGEQAADLLEVAGLHRVPVGHAEGEDLRAGTDRTDDVTRLVRRLEPVAGAPGDLGGQPVALEHAVGHLRFGEHDLVGAEGVGLHTVAADGEKGLVDLLDHVRPGEVEDFGDVLVPEPVAGQIEGARLEIRPHGAVENDNALPGKFEEGGSHSIHPFIRIL
jgi:hypothetical protein